MPIVHVEAHLSLDELLRAAGQLSQEELELFAHRVIALEARRRAPSLPQVEADLLLKINQGVPPEVRDRYDELMDKRRAESLASDEYKELLHLTDEIENLEAGRLENLAELACLRQISLTRLMEELDIRPPTHV